MLGLLVSFTSLFLLLALSKKSWYVTLWGLCCVCLLSLTTLLVGEWNYVSTSSWLAVDGMSRVLVSLTLWILLMMVLASQEVKVSRNKEKGFLYFVFGLGFVLLFCFCLSSTFAFYFFFEASLIPTLLLILGWGYQPERLQAGMYMMIYTLAASLPLLFGLILMQFIHSSSNLLFNHMLRGGLIEHMMLNWLAFILFSAFLVKLPMFSVHLWLPKAHVEAPVAGSMILAAILLKLGGYGILRVYQYSNFVGTESLIFLLAVGLWGGMLCSIACFRQVDFKALIAYSSIGHMALVLAGVFSESSWGWGGAVVLMVSHAFCSSALFALANYSYSKTATRSVMLVGGMLAVSPSLTLWWFLFSALNMACPPSINLMGEIMIFPSSMFYFGPFVLPVAMMSFLAALYSMYLYTVTQHGGNPKYLNSFITYKPLTLTLLSLHWLPANFAILKAETVFF